METFFLAVILGVIAFSLYKLPSNEYTPVNDIDNGFVRHYPNEISMSETKHEASYEEKDH